MRFSNIVAVFAAVASVSSALQNIPSTDGSIDAIAVRGLAAKKPAAAKGPAAKAPVAKTPVAKASATKSKSGKVNICNAKQVPRSMRIKGLKARMDEDTLVEDGNTWYVYEGNYLDASKIKAGQSVMVFDLTGCSAVFFFNSNGKASVAHITAGKESVQARDAAMKAKAAGCTASVTVGAMDDTHFQKIEKEISIVMPGIKVTPQNYKSNKDNSNESHMYTQVTGSTTITHTTANC